MPDLREIAEYEVTPILTFPRRGGRDLFSPPGRGELEWGRYLKEMAC